MAFRETMNLPTQHRYTLVSFAAYNRMTSMHSAAKGVVCVCVLTVLTILEHFDNSFHLMW